ncbi:hypothetical protein PAPPERLAPAPP_04450 [Brevundimonas phage vB_BpoS-Papperlapapp]|uniref:Uncharacterized protein n=2 Tax=Marchewkavirus TaxID=3425052 RepID=A0A9E7MQB2_9CAUD|nr:hypothetical protein KABACHOK_02830 [Brevundimonas phage vB_BpoS-Kabachok]USN14814.1 hypothetical protein DOMOVOI_03400 [Brevundimonas phage vB_BpoS-Domovoi]USN16186.1 hypothetical protein PAPPERLAPAPP_04450 [Brevundimonas phage vB_BpoS-Papperlapapp]
MNATDAREPEDFSALIGLTILEAEALTGGKVRATLRDGRPQIGTCDYRLDRINVSTVDGLITAVGGRG